MEDGSDLTFAPLQSTSGVQAIPTAHSKCPLQKKPRPLLPRHTVDVSEIALCLEELKLAYSISGVRAPGVPLCHLRLRVIGVAKKSILLLHHCVC